MIIFYRAFQFHKGTIRTCHDELVALGDIDFNSIKVRLERSDKPYADILVPFQFHKGTIRTPLPLLHHLTLPNFNSIKVRLEHDGNLTSYPDSLISIP